MFKRTIALSLPLSLLLLSSGAQAADLLEGDKASL